MLLPVARPLPLPVKVADEVDPEAISVTVPSVLPPTENVTLPVGAVLPLPGFTVATSRVVPVVTMLVGLAVTVVVVVTVVDVIVTATEADETAKSAPGSNVAAILLLPVDRLVPLTVKDAEAVVPDEGAVKVTDPSQFPPLTNTMVPVGTVVPLTGVTFAVKTVEEDEAMLVALAASVILVPTAAGALDQLVTRL